MSKNEAQTALVPRLRFPEFRDTGPWVSKRLGDFATILKGKGISKADIAANGENPCIRYAELYTHYGDVIHKVVSRTNLAATELVLSNEQDVVIPASGETKSDIATASCVMQKNVALGSDLNIIRTNLHGPFFSYYLNGAKRHDIARVAQGDTVAHLYPTQLQNIEISYPTLGEQQKIAECLGSLDDLIEAEGRNLASLRDHKQGLMQQLFPREGESQPQLRFPEFRDAGVWQIQELGNMTSKVGSGITPKGGSKNYTESGRPFVRSQNVGWGYLLLDDMVHIDEDTHASFDGTEIEEGDVLLNISGASIGRSAVADRRIASGNVNQHVCIIRTDQTSIHPIMLSQYLGSDLGQEQVDRCQAGGNRQGLNFSQIRSFMIPVPYSYSEQQRIADCLSALDDRIAAQTEKLDALRSHKHGLLQQLFPAPPLEGVAT